MQMLVDSRHEAHVVLRDHVQEIEMSPEGMRETERIGRGRPGRFGKVGEAAGVIGLSSFVLNTDAGGKMSPRHSARRRRYSAKQ